MWLQDPLNPPHLQVYTSVDNVYGIVFVQPNPHVKVSLQVSALSVPTKCNDLHACQVRALAFVAVLTYQVMVALAATEEAVEAAVAHELTLWECLNARARSRHARHGRPRRRVLKMLLRVNLVREGSNCFIGPPAESFQAP